MRTERELSSIDPTESILLTRRNRHVVLTRRPQGYPSPQDFTLVESELARPAAGEFLAKNRFVSLDAGFRNWMNESAGDDVLPAQALDQPVTGLTLAEVIDSRHPDYTPGDMLMARFAWEEYSTSDGSDFIARLPTELDYPPSYYLGLLGDTGMSAYFGLTEIAIPRPGETVLVSAAGGAVGSIAGQIARILGARAVGISSSPEKCKRLIDDLGYDATVDRNSEQGLDSAIESACPDGIDVYFDNVGGETLQAAIAHMNLGGRIALCGSITAYNSDEPVPGPNNLFDLVTKEITMRGFLTHFREDRYDEARSQLEAWLAEGRLKNVEYPLEGIENVGVAFCDMFAGRNFGKTLVRLRDA